MPHSTTLLFSSPMDVLPTSPGTIWLSGTLVGHDEFQSGSSAIALAASEDASVPSTWREA